MPAEITNWAISPSHPMLHKMQHLAGLTEGERAILVRACSEVVRIEADRDILRQGDRPGASNLLLEGFVCRYAILPSGKRQILAFHVPGDLYNTQSFLLEAMDHSVATLTPCRLALVPHAVLREITDSHPRLTQAIWRETLVGTAVQRCWTANVGRRDAAERAAHLMCELFIRLRAAGLARGGEIDWPLTQEELGDALGLSTVHVNRTLQLLRKQRLISLRDGVLVILDWDGLAGVAGFSGDYLHLGRDALRSALGRAGAATIDGLNP